MTDSPGKTHAAKNAAPGRKDLRSSATTRSSAAGERVRSEKATIARQPAPEVRTEPTPDRTTVTQMATVPDLIIVREYDPSQPGADSPGPARRPLRVGQTTEKAFNISSRRIEVQIAPERITEIQQALVRTGFYAGEPTGVWDDATYEAMKQFQISRRIDATGYPTAQSLKLLGLTRW